MIRLPVTIGGRMIALLLLLACVAMAGAGMAYRAAQHQAAASPALDRAVKSRPLIERLRDGHADHSAAATRSAMSDLTAVTAATEQISASAQGIAGRALEAADATRDAVGHADRNGTRVQTLLEAAHRIVTVVDLIASIAGRTNLLALNATIEASRAGRPAGASPSSPARSSSSPPKPAAPPPRSPVRWRRSAAPSSKPPAPPPPSARRSAGSRRSPAPSSPRSTNRAAPPTRSPSASPASPKWPAASAPRWTASPTAPKAAAASTARWNARPAP